MPELSLWFIRAALIHFSLGITAGTLILCNKGFVVDYRLWGLMPAHIESLLAGWLINLVMGVAYWMLPRFQYGPLRGNEKIMWLVFVLLNSGIALTVLGKTFFEGSNLPALGRFMEFLSVPLFASQMWRRLYSTRDFSS